MLNNKLVSVIVPVYNAEKYIRQALKSIITQDYPYKEIIIVDDCSTDMTYEMVRDIISKTPYVVYYKLDKNSGVAVARNVAIGLAKGRFIAFLDSDDVWNMGKLTEQLKLFEKYKGTPFTYTAIEYIDEKGNVIKRKRNLKEKVTYSYLLRNTIIATSTVIIDREVVKSIVMPNRRSAEDYSLWLTILKEYGVAHGINYAYTQYRKTANSISANRIGEVKFFYAVQVEDLQIPKLQVGFNTVCYILNAVKKHFL